MKENTAYGQTAEITPYRLTSCYSNRNDRPHRRRTDHSIVLDRWRQCAPYQIPGSFGSREFAAPNGISIGSAVSPFCSSTYQRDRHTDHGACNICSSRPHRELLAAAEMLAKWRNTLDKFRRIRRHGARMIGRAISNGAYQSCSEPALPRHHNVCRGSQVHRSLSRQRAVRRACPGPVESWPCRSPYWQGQASGTGYCSAGSPESGDHFTHFSWPLFLAVGSFDISWLCFSWSIQFHWK